MSSPQKSSQRGDRLDNLVDSLSHIYCTENETRSHKFPNKYDNMIVPEQVKPRQRELSSTSLNSPPPATEVEPVSKSKKTRKESVQLKKEKEDESTTNINGDIEIAPRKKRWSMVVNTSSANNTSTSSKRLSRVSLRKSTIDEQNNNEEEEENDVDIQVCDEGEDEEEEKKEAAPVTSKRVRPVRVSVGRQVLAPRKKPRELNESTNTDADFTPKKGMKRGNKRKSILPSAVDASEHNEDSQTGFSTVNTNLIPPFQLPEGNLVLLKDMKKS